MTTRLAWTKVSISTACSRVTSSLITVVPRRSDVLILETLVLGVGHSKRRATKEIQLHFMWFRNRPDLCGKLKVQVGVPYRTHCSGAAGNYLLAYKGCVMPDRAPETSSVYVTRKSSRFWSANDRHRTCVTVATEGLRVGNHRGLRYTPTSLNG